MPGSAPLVSVPEAPVPQGGAAEWFRGAGGIALRAALFSPPGKPRGSVVVSPGRTEFIEKYYEVVQDLLDRGFVVLIHDWRGQGLSDRLLEDRMRGHAAGFADFVADHGSLLTHFESRLPKPWISLSHSTGGCITLIALAQGERRFDGAGFSAPMFGVRTGSTPALAARTLAAAMVRMGRGAEYIQNDPGDPYLARFEDNILTHDERRWRRTRALIEQHRELALGGGTWGWLDFAFSSFAWLRGASLKQVTIPILAVGAGDERLVDNGAQRTTAARLPNARYTVIPGSYHEILQETDAIRAAWWAEFDAFVATV